MTDFLALLSSGSSRAVTDMAVAAIAGNAKKFAEVYGLIFSQRPPVSWRAAWAVDFCIRKNPDLLLPYLKDIMYALPNFTSVGCKRIISGIVSRCEIPDEEELHSVLWDTCWKWLHDVKIPVGIKIYSLEILYKLTHFYPELKSELAVLLEEHMRESTPGFKSRGKKLIKLLYKEIYS